MNWNLTFSYAPNKARLKTKIDDNIVNPVYHFFDRIDEFNEFGLKTRDGQIDMALDISEAFRDNNNIIIEAGVGIGKSLAYLIPALFITDMLDQPIVIATSSIQLTEQLYFDTLKASELTKIYAAPVIGKGKSHYVCLNKVDNIAEGNTRVNQTLVKWAKENQTGDRSSFEGIVTDKDWSYINVDSCMFERCLNKNVCHFFKMRNAIAGVYPEINIIIVNQDLLIRHLLNKREDGKGFMKNNIPLIIIDEAHNLEDKVRNGLTESYDNKKVESIFSRIDYLFSVNNIPDSEKNMKKTKIIFNEFMLNIFSQINDHLNISGNFEQERYKINFPKHIDSAEWSICIENIRTSLSIMDDNRNERETGELLVELSNLKSVISDFKEDTDSLNLFWATMNYKKNVDHTSICFCPKNIDEILRENLFDGESKVVLTSATLTQNGKTTEEKYSYISNSIGYHGEFIEPKVSPFDYQNNSILYICNDVAPYKIEERQIYINRITNKIVELCNITNGRTLVLFTSKEDLKEVKVKLNLMETDWEKFYQNEGSSQASTIKAFREAKGVLLGTGVFWEGINIEGSDLMQVIIVRLPFPVPNDPIIEYKISRSKNSMKEILIPEMLIRLRQGAGRLIRSESDKGILSILDSRISSVIMREYRYDVLTSLSTKNVTENIQDIIDFRNTNLNVE